MLEYVLDRISVGGDRSNYFLCVCFSCGKSSNRIRALTHFRQETSAAWNPCFLSQAWSNILSTSLWGQVYQVRGKQDDSIWVFRGWPSAMLLSCNVDICRNVFCQQPENGTSLFLGVGWDVNAESHLEAYLMLRPTHLLYACTHTWGFSETRTFIFLFACCVYVPILYVSATKPMTWICMRVWSCTTSMKQDKDISWYFKYFKSLNCTLKNVCSIASRMRAGGQKTCLA